jgi:polysaccharide biosynthesis/export protein/SLBB domain-containing protein
VDKNTSPLRGEFRLSSLTSHFSHSHSHSHSHSLAIPLHAGGFDCRAQEHGSHYNYKTSFSERVGSARRKLLSAACVRVEKTIRVFRQPDFNTTARVGYDGSVMVPLVGRIQVAGLSVDEAARLIQSKLAAGFLPDPQVSVNVTEFNHRRFTVLGQVTRSGTYDFPDERPLDLLQAIGLAGGYTNIANRASVTIKRNIGGKISVFKVNAKKLAEGKADYDVQVQPGDIITVAESLF